MLFHSSYTLQYIYTYIYLGTCSVSFRDVVIRRSEKHTMTYVITYNYTLQITKRKMVTLPIISM